MREHNCPFLVEKEESNVVNKGSMEVQDSPSVKSIFAAVENRHDTLFDDNAGRHKLHAAPILTSSAASASQNAAGSVKSIKSLDKLENVSKNANAKQARIAQKAKDLLLKGKAIGYHKDIAVEDRFYLMTTLANSGHFDRKCIFVNSNTTTLGDLCDWVSKTFPFPMFKQVMRPVGWTVYMITTEATGDEESGFKADYDRRALVSTLLQPMEHVYFTKISSSAAAQAQDVIAKAVDAAAQEAAAKQAAVEAEAVAAKAALVEKVSADSVCQPDKVTLGESVIYVKDGLSEMAKITAIHRDDYPNLYFTISYVSKLHGSETIERQTTAKYLRYPSSEKIPEEAGGFGIQLIHGGKTHRIDGIGPMMLVAAVKKRVQDTTGVLPKNQKLICKGKVLTDSELVSSTKLSRGCKVTLMGKK